MNRSRVDVLMSTQPLVAECGIALGGSTMEFGYVDGVVTDVMDTPLHWTRGRLKIP